MTKEKDNAINALLENPEFEKAGKVHDWRNYVPEEFELLWHDLTMKERYIIYVMAEKVASNEEWD